MRSIWFFLVFFFFISNGFAAEPVELPLVTIHGERESAGEGTAASRQSIKVSDYSHRIITVPEILSEQAGVTLTRYGGLEDSTSISIRGSKSDEVLVTL